MCWIWEASSLEAGVLCEIPQQQILEVWAVQKPGEWEGAASVRMLLQGAREAVVLSWRFAVVAQEALGWVPVGILPLGFVVAVVEDHQVVSVVQEVRVWEGEEGEPTVTALALPTQVAALPVFRAVLWYCQGHP